MNGQKNKKFLNSLSHKSGLKNLILTNIADHYRIDIIEAYEEVIDEDAEHILEYVTTAIFSSMLQPPYYITLK